MLTGASPLSQQEIINTEKIIASSPRTLTFVSLFGFFDHYLFEKASLCVPNLPKIKLMTSVFTFITWTWSIFIVIFHSFIESSICFSSRIFIVLRWFTWLAKENVCHKNICCYSVPKLCSTLCDPLDCIACQAPLSSTISLSLCKNISLHFSLNLVFPLYMLKH